MPEQNAGIDTRRGVGEIRGIAFHEKPSSPLRLFSQILYLSDEMGFPHVDDSDDRRASYPLPPP